MRPVRMLGTLAMLAAVSVGCVGCVAYDGPAELGCSLGGACPPGYECDLRDVVCRVPGGACGDGVRNVGEQCEDGNTASGDGCRGDCAGLEVCGDHLLDGNEACDDGNAIDGDGCDSDCSLTRCGNGIKTAGEVCDDGNTQSGDGCTADCAKLEICGDSTLDVGEVCDDGNRVFHDGCRADCAGIEVCGDAQVDFDEQCDGQLDCDARCRFATCGDGAVAAGEMCWSPLARFLEAVPNGAQALGAESVVTGDLDRDGHLDLVSLGTVQAGRVVRVQLGDGAGRYAAAIQVPTLLSNAAVLADLDGDGDLDLIGVTGNTAGVAIHLNTGGVLDAGHAIPGLGLSSSPDSLLVGDIDGDGDLDIIIGPDASSRVLRNTGAATFTVEASPASGRPLALGDIDQDGDLDLVSGDGVLRNDATGHYGAIETIVSSNRMSVGVLSDLDGDNDLDLVAFCNACSDLSVFTNDGTGSFASEARFPVGGSNPSIGGGLVVGDLDGDGDRDIVFAAAQSGEVLTLRNTGGGSFAAPVASSVAQPTSLALGDLDGDGDLDVAVASQNVKEGTLLLNLGNGTLDAPRAFASFGAQLTVQPVAFASADFDGDGALDLAIVDQGLRTLSIAFTDGAGSFSRSTSVAMPAGTVPDAIAAVDLDGDSDLDLVVLAVDANLGLGEAIVFKNTGAAGFVASPAVVTDLSAQVNFPGATIGIGDLDGDGAPDVVAGFAGNDRIAILLDTGGGSLGPPTDFPIVAPGQAAASARLVVGDVNDDAKIDIVISNEHPTNSAIVTLLGDGAGAFGPPTALSLVPPVAGARLALADLDGDGELDLLVLHANLLSVLVNPGTGSFAAPVDFSALTANATELAIGDVDADGALDVVVTDPSGAGSMNVLRNLGGHVFGAPFRVGPAAGALGVTIVDLDHDGAVDLVWTAQNGSGVSRVDVLRARP